MPDVSIKMEEKLIHQWNADRLYYEPSKLFTMLCGIAIPFVFLESCLF
jgi:hypothetical protein